MRAIWRRQQGYGRGGRMKIETDAVEILSGVRHGRTLGSPVSLVVRNRDHENWREVMRDPSRLRSDIRQLREIVEAGEAGKAADLLPKTLSLIDKSIQKGILHDNAAARYKSRLTRLVKKASQSGAKA